MYVCGPAMCTVRKPGPSLLLRTLEGLPVAGCLALSSEGWVTGLTEDLRPRSQADLHSLVLFQPRTLGLQSLGDEPREDTAVPQPSCNHPQVLGCHTWTQAPAPKHRPVCGQKALLTGTSSATSPAAVLRAGKALALTSEFPRMRK